MQHHLQPSRYMLQQVCIIIFQMVMQRRRDHFRDHFRGPFLAGGGECGEDVIGVDVGFGEGFDFAAADEERGAPDTVFIFDLGFIDVAFASQCGIDFEGFGSGEIRADGVVGVDDAGVAFGLWCGAVAASVWAAFIDGVEDFFGRWGRRCRR